MKLSEFITYLQELAEIGDAEVLVQKRGMYGNNEPTLHPIVQILHQNRLPTATPDLISVTDSAGVITSVVVSQDRFKAIIVFDEVVR